MKNVMFYYNKLRQLNPGAAKTKAGRSALMAEAFETIWLLSFLNHD